MSIAVSHEGAITIITIGRPAARNAIDGPSAIALAAAFVEFDADDKSSVAILTGGEGSFCAGADLKAFGGASGRRNPLNPDMAAIGPMGPSRLRLSKPVIAAISGHAVAGGLELALWCDLRVAEKSAVLGVFCRRWGVPLIDGGTVRLPRLIGTSRAMDLILTGRAVTAEEAYTMGLVNRVVPDGSALSAAIELAQAIAAHPQTCMRNDRLSLLEQESLDEKSALANEFALGMRSLASSEGAAGVQRFVGGAGRHGEDA